VRLFLWYNSGGEHSWKLSETPIDRMSDPSIRRAEMEKISGWGIAGIKIDFFSSDKQDRIEDADILARRRGTNWYVAGIHTAQAPVEYAFTLDFLAPGTYELALIEQGGSADSFERTVQSVEAGDPVTITLPPNGGFVATLTAQ
jgi:hypothetical protein